MNSPPAGPYVSIRPLFAALKGNEAELLNQLGIPWQSGRPHIRCPYRDHADSDPSWRWDASSAKAFCTCASGDHAVDVVAKVLGLDFEAAKIRAAELIGRPDLIRQPRTKQAKAAAAAPAKTSAAALLAPSDDKRDDGLVTAYLGFRLGVPLDQVPLPVTRLAGWRALGYYDHPFEPGAFPAKVGEFPCAVFGMLDPDGHEHAHRIYLAPGGQGKAALGTTPDGYVRDPKKSARLVSGERVAGKAVLWGNAAVAPCMIVCEGIETAAAVALLFKPAIGAEAIAVAAAISATGMEQFRPWLAARRIIVAADRDDAAKPDGRPASKRGELAARKLAGRIHAQLDAVSIALPGLAGETVDWLDVLRRDGIEAMRTAFGAAEAFDPSEANEGARGAEVIPFPARDGAGSGTKGPARSRGPAWFRSGERGLERLVEQDDKDTGESRKEWRWFGSRLDILAATRDSAGQEWGLLLEITDKDAGKHQWAMPMSMLAGDGTAYRERLLSLGFVAAPGRIGKEALHEYLATARPDRRARCVARVGWHGGRFVLPEGATFSAPSEADEEVILQGATPLNHSYRVAGTFEDWQREVAEPARGNSRLVLALSIAFAAPLLHLLGQEGGGFHVRGQSSIGKSTALIVAGSAWGGGGVGGYVRSWRSTDNGLETTAAAHCDAPLLLDELAQIAPEAAGATAYMLTAGAGKVRAGRHGEGRAVAEWRTLFLSNGEIGLADKIAEDGRGRRAMAGQAVRVVDLPADAGTGLGMFEDLHGFGTADAFARHLKAAAAKSYGHAARKFLETIVRDLPGTVEAVRKTQAGFAAEFCPAGCDGQVTRVAQRFGLAAAAGELAAQLGVLPWAEGEARAGASRCFAAWIGARGGAGSAEEMEAISKVRRFAEQHGSTRFERIGDEPESEEKLVKAEGQLARDRVGFRRLVPAGLYLYVLRESWKEVCGGSDPALTAKALAARGMLRVGADGKLTRSERLPVSKGKIRCYVLMPKLFEE